VAKNRAAKASLPPNRSIYAHRKHLTDKAAFGPAAIEAIFEETCIALQVPAGDENGREIIATRIIDLARSGLIDPAALRDRVITEARLGE
jgi:hypothetical protein